MADGGPLEPQERPAEGHETKARTDDGVSRNHVPQKSFSMAHALSMVRRRQEEQRRVQEEQQRAQDEEKKEKARAKRQRRRQNQKLAKAKAREAIASNKPASPKAKEVVMLVPRAVILNRKG